MAHTKEVDLDQVRTCLNSAIYKLQLYSDDKAPADCTGMYSILSKKFPLYTDSCVPPAAMDNLKSNHTPACADERHVYFSCEMFKELWEEGINKAVGNGPVASNNAWDMENSIIMLLIHEYTHIVMEHCKRLKAFAKRSKNTENIYTYTLACEIEANRGWDMPQDTYTYKIGVTEDTFPECKDVHGLTNIYNALKKAHGNDIDDYASQAKASSKGKSGKDEEENKGTEKKQGNAQKSENGTSTLSKEQKKALEKIVKGQHSEQLMEQEGNNDKEGKGTSISGGKSDGLLEKEYGSTLEALEEFNSRELQRDIATDLLKLKGVLTGEDVAMSRVKTYSRPARRAGEGSLMRKGVKRGNHKSPRVLIALDCSGSMSDTTTAEVMSTCASIIKATGTKVSGSYICTHDEHVAHMSPLHEWENVVKLFRPYGGNCFNDLLKRALQLDIDVVIDLGDGYDAITDERSLKKAKEKKLKWVDVIVNSTLSKERLEGFLDMTEKHLEEVDLRLERQILKIK